MHVGHYRDAMDARIQMNNPGVAGFFSPRKWRIFVHSALALRMASLPPRTREPCCDLHVIGGDGTGIGIPLRNIDIEPVWAPPDGGSAHQPRDSTINRCAIGPTDSEGTPTEFEKARLFVHQVTSRATSGIARGTLRDSIDDHADFIPMPLLRALEVFLIMDETEPHWKDVRVILSSLSKTESLSGVITVVMLEDMKLLVSRMRLQPTVESDDALIQRLCSYGMGPEISRVFRAELAHSLARQPPVQRPSSVAFADLFEYIGKFNVHLHSTLIQHIFYARF
jgi:hypothetical protein